MNDVEYFLKIIRELERNIGALTQQLDDERKRHGRPIVIEHQAHEIEVDPSLPPSKPKLPALKAGEHATYIEGVAYEGRNMRNHQGDHRFRHFPITTIAVFASDADARKYLRERENPGYPKRLGSVIVEVVDKKGPVIRRRRSPTPTIQLELPDIEESGPEAGGEQGE